MREIEFRAWDNHAKRMLSDVVIGFDNEVLVLNYEETELVPMYSNEMKMLYKIREHDIIPMQFTGLLDKNGVKIFEGDIIDIHQTVNGCNIFVVTWDKLGWNVKYGTANKLYEYDIKSFFAPCQFTGEPDYEVIGNIFETPHLRESK